MQQLKTIDDLPFAPCLAPWVKRSWLPKITVEPPPEGCRIWGRELVGPCWLYHGADNGKGHKKVRVDGRLQYFHRFSFAQFYGIPIHLIEAGDHLCRNRNCFNPLHIDNVTSIENWLRGDGHLTTFKSSFETAEENGQQNMLSDADLRALLGDY